MATGVSPDAAAGGPARAMELTIGGMTCASCAARVEKKLNKLDGVSATVNYATGTARVRFPAAMPATELISAVEQAGYTAALPLPAPGGRPPGDPPPEGIPSPQTPLGQRLLVSLALAVNIKASVFITSISFAIYLAARLAGPLLRDRRQQYRGTRGAQPHDGAYPRYAAGPTGTRVGTAMPRSGEPPEQMGRHIPSGLGWPGEPPD